MAQITFKGKEFRTSGDLPKVGSIAPYFMLTRTDLTTVTLKDFQGKRLVLNIFPSIDTSVCATSVRRFNSLATQLDNTVVLCVSMDLPFAQSRFCGAEELDDVLPVSDFRSGDFARDYGVRIMNGPLEGLLARAVLVVNEASKIIYAELVPEITQEPDYEGALKELR